MQRRIESFVVLAISFAEPICAQRSYHACVGAALRICHGIILKRLFFVSLLTSFRRNVALFLRPVTAIRDATFADHCRRNVLCQPVPLH